MKIEEVNASYHINKTNIKKKKTNITWLQNNRYYKEKKYQFPS